MSGPLFGEPRRRCAAATVPGAARRRAVRSPTPPAPRPAVVSGSCAVPEHTSGKGKGRSPCRCGSAAPGVPAPRESSARHPSHFTSVAHPGSRAGSGTEAASIGSGSVHMRACLPGGHSVLYIAQRGVGSALRDLRSRPRQLPGSSSVAAPGLRPGGCSGGGISPPILEEPHGDVGPVTKTGGSAECGRSGSRRT